MVEPRTMSEVLGRLHAKGYTHNCRVCGKILRITPGNFEIEPEQVSIDVVYRFEGETDLDDEAIIFALSCPQQGIKATYVAAYGPKMDADDADMIQRLHTIFDANEDNHFSGETD